MSDRDAEHLLNELQEARSEIDKLRLGVGFAKEILVQLQSEKKALEASALQSNAEVLELIKSNEKLRGKNNKLSEILEYIRDKTEIGDYAPCVPIPWHHPKTGKIKFHVPQEPGWPSYSCSLVWFINHVELIGPLPEGEQ
jgi:hypothetical protein